MSRLNCETSSSTFLGSSSGGKRRVWREVLKPNAPIACLMVASLGLGHDRPHGTTFERIGESAVFESANGVSA